MIEVTLDGAQVSDLFFNYEKPELDSALAGWEEDAPKTHEAVDEALLAAAKDFSSLLGGQVTPEWLVENYKARV